MWWKKERTVDCWDIISTVMAREETTGCLVYTLPSTVVISAANSRGNVIFVARGDVDGGMTLTLTSRDGKFLKLVVMNLAGRVQID